MATQLIFMKNNKSVRAGLEVSVHWKGMLSGYTKLKTDSSGCVYVEDNLINGARRETDTIYIDNPDGGYSLKFPNVTIEKGTRMLFQLENAQRQ